MSVQLNIEVAHWLGLKCLRALLLPETDELICYSYKINLVNDLYQTLFFERHNKGCILLASLWFSSIFSTCIKNLFQTISSSSYALATSSKK